MNKSFSKIWIVVILIVFVAGGILAWQYFRVPKEEVKVSEVDKCKDIQDLGRQIKCYTDLAKETKDETWCGKINIPEAPEVKASCYVELAILKNNPSLCWQVKTASLSSSCWEYFGMKHWKIYRNEKYGFEVRYPIDWNLGVIQPDEFSPKGDWGEQIGELAIFQSRLVGVPYCELHLTIYSNPKNLSIRDFWRKRLPEVYKFKSSENVIFEERQISGVKFFMERIDQPLPNESMSIVVKKNNNIIELFWWGQGPAVANPACLKVDQILSTFRFLE